ncbi:MAG: fibrobacter succinogenes major paralogous domain-containing protein, partial [Sediminibacterium sp.]
STVSFSQVGIGTTTPAASAQLDVTSTTKGLLPPRMTTSQRNAISNPANGLIIYNTTSNCFQINIGTSLSPNWPCASMYHTSTNGTADASVLGGSPCGVNVINGQMNVGTPVNNVRMTMNINVTQLGSWNITAGPVNGVTFTGSGTFTALGCQTINLNGSGTPTTSGVTTWTTNTTPSGSASVNVIVPNISSGGTAVVSSWTSDVGCSIGAGTNNSPAGVRRGGVNQTLVQGVSAPSTATITLEANITTAGSFDISTNTVNGVTFSASGLFISTGNQTVTLTPSGTPIMAGNFIWTLNTTPSINIYGSVITKQAPIGSTYNSHFNGIIGTTHSGTTWQNASQTTGEVFSNNTTCQNKPISAQGCGGVSFVSTVSGRVHPTVRINGQCWLQTNLITIPSVYDNYTTGSWTNSGATSGDQGYWGYYHTTDATGASGFQSSEPGTNEGLLYQWCGAMDATISERSRGICPEGWHIPSDCEWMYLEHGQGMSISEQNLDNVNRANGTDNQGTPGYKLRSAGPGQTNASGFSGLLPGARAASFTTRLQTGYWWSSTATAATTANRRYLDGTATPVRGVHRLSTSSKFNAFSVRCLKD